MCDIIQRGFEPSLEPRVEQRRRDVRALANALLCHYRIKERAQTPRLGFVADVPREFLSTQACWVCGAVDQERCNCSMVPDFSVPGRGAGNPHFMKLKEDNSTKQMWARLDAYLSNFFSQ
jgi:hypothetical protein